MSMHKHIRLEETAYFYFESNDTAGSGDDGASTLVDVRLGGAAANAAPVYSTTATLLSDAGYPDGSYEIAIPATAANGFADDSQYGVFATLTVDATNPTKFVGGITTAPIPATVDNLSTGSAAISTVAESFTKAGAEPETNTYVATQQLDGAYHEVEDDGGTTDVYYQFDVGGDGVPTEFIWVGYAQGNNDEYQVFAYNWGGASWDQIETITASNGTSIQSITFQATNAHRGVGANLGKVRLRFLSTDGSKIATDRVLCSYAIVARSVGYALGSIWVNTNKSNTNTEIYVDGVADNPVSTWEAALTLNATLGLNRFVLTPNSSTILTENSDNYQITNIASTIDLNGQSVSGTRIQGGTIVGNDSGSNLIPTVYEACFFTNSSLGQHIFSGCGIQGNVTLAESGDYMWYQCASFVPGNNTPDIIFAAPNTGVNFRGYSGGIQVNGMAATDTMSLEGWGQLKIAAGCTGGNISIRGNIGPVTDNAGGAVSLTENARVADDTINAEVDQAILDAGIVASLDAIAGFIDTEITDIQSRLPAVLVSGRIDANMSAINDNAQAAVRLALSAASIVPGTAVAGTLSATQMSTDLTEVTNDHYNGALLIWTSGNLKDQRTAVTAYDGTTKVLTYVATTEPPGINDTFILV